MPPDRQDKGYMCNENGCINSLFWDWHGTVSFHVSALNHSQMFVQIFCPFDSVFTIQCWILPSLSAQKQMTRNCRKKGHISQFPVGTKGSKWPGAWDPFIASCETNLWPAYGRIRQPASVMWGRGPLWYPHFHQTGRPACFWSSLPRATAGPRCHRSCDHKTNP